MTREDTRGGGEPPVTTTLPPRYTAARFIPLDFNVYTESAISTDFYYIGPHQKDRLFALTNYGNSFTPTPRPFLILHDGLTRRDPAIGTATNATAQGLPKCLDKFLITAPSFAGSSSPPVQEPLVVVNKGEKWRRVFALRYSVQVPVPATNSNSGGTERQEFEWQEIGKGSRGWRLVALADESETLAVCIPTGGSLTKFLRFSFMGKGRTSDHYGVTWEVMAILTGFTTWNRRVDMNMNDSMT